MNRPLPDPDEVLLNLDPELFLNLSPQERYRTIADTDRLLSDGAIDPDFKASLSASRDLCMAHMRSIYLDEKKYAEPTARTA